MKFYEKNFTWLNALAGIVTALVIFLLDHFLCPNILADFLKEHHRNFYGVLASVYGALLGFTITTVSLLLSFSKSPSLALIRKSTHYNTIWSIFKGTMRWLGLGTILSIILLFPNGDNQFVLWLSYFSAGLLVYVTLLIERCIWVLGNIIDLVTKEK